MKQTINNLRFGATYKLSVWAITKPGSTQELTLVVEDAAAPDSSCHVTEAWTECTRNFVAGSASSPKLFVYTNHEPELDLDDISIFEVPGNLVRNPGFEDDFSRGWEQLDILGRCNFQAVNGHTSAHKL